jgi:hypothetical protein
LLGTWERLLCFIETDRLGSVVIGEIIRSEEQVEALTAGWYIWWERRNHVHCETVQRASRSAMSIAALT